MRLSHSDVSNDAQISIPHGKLFGNSLQSEIACGHVFELDLIAKPV